MIDDYEIIEKLSRKVCELHAENERLRARIDANAIEYDRLLSRCAELEHVRQQAQALIDYEDAGPDDPAGKSWMHWEEKFEALRDALKAAPQ